MNQNQIQCIHYLPLAKDDIANYNLYYTTNNEIKCYEIEDIFLKTLEKWHMKKYIQKPAIIIERANASTTIIKYITQFVRYNVIITSVVPDVKDYTNCISLKVTLSKMQCITQFSDDYEQIIGLTEYINNKIATKL